MKYSEFEIQSEVYQTLKSHFPTVRGEFFYEPVDRRCDPYRCIRAYRFDVVAFNEKDEIVAVIEVKKRKGKHRISHYQKWVLAPVILVEGMDELPNLIPKITAAISSYTPPREAVKAANDFMIGISAYVA